MAASPSGSVKPFQILDKFFILEKMRVFEGSEVGLFVMKRVGLIDGNCVGLCEGDIVMVLGAPVDISVWVGGL